MTLIDSHCHLDDAQFAADREATIARAQAAGVTEMLAIGTGDGPPDLETAIRLADRYPFIRATIGVHPHDASKATPETFDYLRRLSSHSQVVALGEIGLDYHYDFSPRDVQQSVFVAQLAIAAESSLPIVIHTREAWDDTLALLRAHWHGARRGPGIMHCFTGGPEEARQALDLGFHLAFGGVITFPKAGSTRESARLTPLDRLLVETDCPYLAPVPHRGKRNEPAFILEIVKYLAEIRHATPAEIAEATTRNFRALFPRK
jgi:TatD DNase family protein